MSRYTVLRYYRGIFTAVIDTVRFQSSRYAYGIIAVSFLYTCAYDAQLHIEKSDQMFYFISCNW